jgi:hypothetical protein
MDERRIIDRRALPDRRIDPQIERLRVFGARRMPSENGEMVYAKKGDWVLFTQLNEANMRICKLGIAVQDLEAEVKRLNDLIATRGFIEMEVLKAGKLIALPENRFLHLIEQGELHG